MQPISVILLLLAFGQAPAPFGAVRQRIQSAISTEHVPAVSVAVAQHGHIIWEEGFGFADADHKIVAGARTAYNIASITKPMTATAVMRLVEQRRIELDAPVNHYLHGMQVTPFPGDTNGPTVRQLLMHRGGLPNHWLPWRENELQSRPPFAETMKRYAFSAWPPGEHYQYSNLDYGVLGEVIAEVSGRPYAEYMRQEIFRPLAMKDSFFDFPAPAGIEVAEPFDRTGHRTPFSDSDSVAGGSAYASVHDLALFGMFHLGVASDAGQAVLSAKSRLYMREASAPTSGTESYGLGWMENSDMLGYSIFFHSGASPGYETALVVVPSESIVIAVLTNINNNDLTIAVTRGILMELLPAFRKRVEDLIKKPPPAQQTPHINLPSTELVGTWKGTVRTYTGDLAVSLTIAAAGEVQFRLGDSLETLVNDPDFEDGSGLRGLSAGDIDTPDLSRFAYDLKIDLTRSGDTMYGTLNTVRRKSDRLHRPYCELGHFVRVQRTGVRPPHGDPRGFGLTPR